VDEELRARLDLLARRFFARPVDDKMRLRMELGGRAWRGYFPVGGELTSGKPDAKEGLYFGAELGEDDPRVRAGVPLHGRNLFPDDLPGFRETVLSYVDALTELGHALMRGIALSLGLEAGYFHDRYMTDPLVLFRIFRYPPVPPQEGEPQWGVGEHTDYGMLTILMQDDVGGLQVKTSRGWTDAPPVPGSFVCNIGDMLDRMTRGLYRSTPHRVVNVSGRERFSFPFFFDPGWDARVGPIELAGAIPQDDREQRWDRASVHAFQGTYGDYILAKVAKVFPQLAAPIAASNVKGVP
jgi:isopenicillin N synthase-like dioxygenase